MNKSVSTYIENEVSEQLREHLSANPKLIIGVSGGADSMALLYVLKKLNADAVVVHINYQQRGKESDKDQELVEQLSFQWGFECVSVKLDEYLNSGNFQNWARTERYRIFEELKEESNADAVAVAHHEDDQVETILMKLFRGSAPENWQGISVFDGNVFRPLLKISKEEILKYCEENAVPFREDKSNTSNKYARNLIRNELAEQMDELLPGWKENVLKLREFGAQNEKAISELTKRTHSESGLSITQLKELDVDLRKAVIKKFVDQQTGITFSSGQLDTVIKLLDAQVGSVFEIDKDLKLVRERDVLKLTSGFEGVFLEISKDDIWQGLSFQSLKFFMSEEKKTEFYLDADCLDYPLSLRTWKSGDKFQPLGMEGSQKVSDHLTNRKVSPTNKKKSLVLVGADGTIYALFFGGNEDRVGTVSEICKATETTSRYLSVSKEI